MEIDRQQVPLLEGEERELVAYVKHLYERGKNNSRKNIWTNCYNAYNQVWSDEFSKEYSWIKDLALYMQTMTQLVDIWESVLTGFLFPSDESYISIEDDVVGKFWEDVLLHNFERTDFISATHEAVQQSAITGENAMLVQPNGPYVEAKPVSIFEVFYTPLSGDLREVSKIHMLKKTEFQLRNSKIGYFNLDKLRDIPFWQWQEENTSTNSVVNKNQPSTHNDPSLGEGFTIYQAYIHYFKFTTPPKRELTNFIATVSINPETLIRFEPQGTIDPFTRNGWKPKAGPGLYYSKGVVEPNLSPLAFSNTMMTMSMVDTFMRILGVYTYNVTDEWTHMQNLRKKMLLQPGGFIPVGPNAQIEPLMKHTNSINVGESFIAFQKNEMVETTGAFPALSGAQEGNLDPTATLTNIRAQAAGGRAALIARHWDQTYLKPIIWRVIQIIQEQLKQVPIVQPDQVTGQPQIVGFQPGFNQELFMFWAKNIGWNQEDVMKHLNDPNFVQQLLAPIELNQIKPTGTQTQANRLQLQTSIDTVIQTAQGGELSQYIQWDKMAEALVEAHIQRKPDDFVLTKEEFLQQQIEQMTQLINGGVDPNTGQPFTNEQLNSLNVQLAALIQQATGNLQQTAPLPTTIPIEVPQESGAAIPPAAGDVPGQQSGGQQHQTPPDDPEISASLQA